MLILFQKRFKEGLGFLACVSLVSSWTFACKSQHARLCLWRKSTALGDSTFIHDTLLNCLLPGVSKAPRWGWGAGRKAWFFRVLGVPGGLIPLLASGLGTPRHSRALGLKTWVSGFTSLCPAWGMIFFLTWPLNSLVLSQSTSHHIDLRKSYCDILTHLKVTLV